MVQKVSEPISVYFSYNHNKNSIFPHFLIWKGRMHQVKKLGLHHTFRKGRTLYHVFSVVSNSLFFRLLLNTESLHWQVEEISDGFPD